MRRPLQILLLLLNFQLAFGVLLVARGFPYFGSRLVDHAPWWEFPVAAYHLPGIQVLSAAGLCCGLGNGAILPLRVIGGHIPMPITGAFLLALTNWFCWSVATLGLYWLWYRRQHGARGAEQIST